MYDFTHVLTADKDVYAEAYDLYTLEFKLTEGSYASASVDKKKVTELITETGETVVFTVMHIRRGKLGWKDTEAG